MGMPGIVDGHMWTLDGFCAVGSHDALESALVPGKRSLRPITLSAQDEGFYHESILRDF